MGEVLNQRSYLVYVFVFLCSIYLKLVENQHVKAIHLT